MMESFWSTMQIELLNRKKWKTRIELANAIFEYIEVFYNRRQRHSCLEYATPHDYDLAATHHHRKLATKSGNQTVGQVRRASARR